MADAAFTGSIPEVYDRCLGPMLFEPFAQDLAARFKGFDGAVLETAAGTGRVTRALAREMAPSATLTATDLNEAMLSKAAELAPGLEVEWRQADAQALPFADGSFDAVVCQFGVMFYPDKDAGYAQAHRVLKPGGRYVFSVWDRLDHNPVSKAIHDAVGALMPDDPPQFLARTPFGYNDEAAIRAGLEKGGFSDVTIETVTLDLPTASAADAASGLCTGSPLRGEIEARADLDGVVAAVTKVLTDRFGEGPFKAKGQAMVVTAKA